MKKVIQKIGRLVGTTCLSTLLIITFQLFTQGMYLIGIPSIENVEKVAITYAQTPDTPQIYTNTESIEMAVHLNGFLKYSLTEKALLTTPPQITLTYFLKDGQTLSVSANQETVWWKGKAHALKNPGHFIKMTQGIFPPQS